MRFLKLLAGRARSMAVCAIATDDFLPWALVLFDSVRRVHPMAKLALLYVDRAGELPRRPIIEGAKVIGVADLVDAATEAALRRRYTIAEMCFALKPRLLQYVLDNLGDRAFYLDSDLDVHGAFNEALVALEDAGAVLTPHLDAPIPMDGKRPSSLTILRAGVYNMGFIGVAQRPETRLLLQWWSDRVFRWGFVAPEFAYQGDQKWMDLAPSLFPSVAVLRDPGYNTGYWNLHSRVVTRGCDAVTANGRPLIFMHWSGIDPDRPQVLSKFQDRIRESDIPDVMALASTFCLHLVAARAKAGLLAWSEAPSRAPSIATADRPRTVGTQPMSDESYRASIEVRRVEGSVETGEEVELMVKVTNTSPSTWAVGRDAGGAGGIALTWHLRGEGGDLIIWDNPRYFLPHDCAAGESIEVSVAMRTPPATGRYKVEFDLVHEGVNWFLEKGNPTTTLEIPVGLS